MDIQSYGKRMWNIWSPLVIKYAIATVIITAALFLMSDAVISEQGQGGIMKLMGQPDEMGKVMQEASGRLADYTVPLEGVIALVTVPVLLFLILRDRKKMKKEEKIKGRAPVWKFLAIPVIAAAMCLGLNNLILLSNLSSYSESYEETIEILYQPSFGVQLVCLGILMPVCEELTYRGLMYRRMRKDMGFLQGALYSSLIFAVTHGNLVQMLYGFAMGMMLSCVYEKYGSVIAPVLAHVTANIVSVAGTQYQWFDWIFQDVFRVAAVTVLCAAAASTVYIFLQRMESRFPDPGESPGNTCDL